MFNLVAKQSLNTTRNIIINPAILARTKVVDIKVKWQRPEKVSRYSRVRSGDLGTYVQPDQSNICLQYQFSSELENAEPNVRNQFTLGWHPMEYSKEFYEKTLMDSVRSHVYDYKSPVAMIAQLTGSIRFMQHAMENGIVHNKKRHYYRLETYRLIRARIELIKNLRKTDYKQYEWLLERLDLQFKPKPQKANEIMIARKEGLRQLTNVYCESVRKEKLQAYQKELEAQQLPFLEQKLKNLQFIRDEQIALKIDITISKEQIDETQKQYDQLKIEHDAKKVEPTKKKWKIY